MNKFSFKSEESRTISRNGKYFAIIKESKSHFVKLFRTSTMKCFLKFEVKLEKINFNKGIINLSSTGKYIGILDTSNFSLKNIFTKKEFSVKNIFSSRYSNQIRFNADDTLVFIN